MKVRLIFFCILLLGGISLALYTLLKKNSTVFEETLSPVLQIVSRPLQELDNAVARVIILDKNAEKDFGEEYARHKGVALDSTPELIYLNSLIRYLTQNKHKNYPYRVYLDDVPWPNAYAMPGGIIHVTQGLLDLLDNESELIAVLAHEIGHIELSHCLNGYKFTMASGDGGRFLDIVNRYFFSFRFSQAQEAEADEFAWAMIQETRYSPEGLANSFEKLLQERGKAIGKPDILKEFYMTHPYLELRVEEFRADAEHYHIQNPTVQHYRGKKNLQELVPLSDKAFKEEWTLG